MAGLALLVSHSEPFRIYSLDQRGGVIGLGYMMLLDDECNATSAGHASFSLGLRMYFIEIRLGLLRLATVQYHRLFD